MICRHCVFFGWHTTGWRSWNRAALSSIFAKTGSLLFGSFRPSLCLLPILLRHNPFSVHATFTVNNSAEAPMCSVDSPFQTPHLPPLRASHQLLRHLFSAQCFCNDFGSFITARHGHQKFDDMHPRRRWCTGVRELLHLLHRMSATIQPRFVEQPFPSNSFTLQLTWRLPQGTSTEATSGRSGITVPSGCMASGTYLDHNERFIVQQLVLP